MRTKVKKDYGKKVLVWHLEALRLQLSDGGGQLGNRGRDVRQLDDAPLRGLCKLSQPCQVIRLSLFLSIKLKSQNSFAVTGNLCQVLRKGGKDSACKRDVPQLYSDPRRLGKPEPDDDEDVDGEYQDLKHFYENIYNNVVSECSKTSG